MRILVIGRSGQVARALVERAGVEDVVAVGRPELDLLDPDAVARAIDAVAPDAIVNAAAYTAVDKAESEPDLAMAVNGVAPNRIAALARNRGLPFIHISTDYVFSGESGQPYRESDATGPLNVYGRSKLAGEEAVLAQGGRALIVRTCWVYSAQGQNFANTMLRLAAEGRDVVRVVDDQRGCPTYAGDIADALLSLARQADRIEQPSIVHFANEGVASWADFAEEIFARARAHGLPSASVERIATADYPTPARRPRCSALDTARMASLFGIEPRPWHDALIDFFEARRQGFTFR